jgi:hypothetical protein
MNPVRKTIISASITIFAFSILSAFGQGTNDLIPPFIAEGSISSEVLTSDATPLFQDEGNFLFSYSNGVWEIQISPKSTDLENITGIDPKKFQKTVINCKRIPDGIRYFMTRAGVDINQVANSSPQGIAEPIPLPPPEEIGLLTCWFSLCPDPDLPILNSTQARRFLSVNLFKSEKNVGAYSRTYLGSQHLFLSTFNITNDGNVFISETKMLKLGPPFDTGFKELSYNVVETTNFNGFLFPLETVFYQLAPRMKNAKTRDDVYPNAVGRLKVEKIDFDSVANEKIGFIRPREMVATDHRSPNLPDGVSAPYLIKNDQWSPITNSEVALIANLTREHGKQAPPNEHKTAHAIVIIVLATTFVAPPIWIFLTRRSNINKNKQ